MRKWALKQSEVVATTLSHERGRYQLTALKPGEYKIRCYTLDGYVYYKPPTDDSGVEGGEEKKEGDILEVTPDTKLSNIDVLR